MAKDNELNPELKDQLIGYKVTKTEKAEVEAFCKRKEIKDVSKFIRHSVKTAMAKG